MEKRTRQTEVGKSLEVFFDIDDIGDIGGDEQIRLRLEPVRRNGVLVVILSENYLSEN